MVHPSHLLTHTFIGFIFMLFLQAQLLISCFHLAFAGFHCTCAWPHLHAHFHHILALYSLPLPSPLLSLLPSHPSSCCPISRTVTDPHRFSHITLIPAYRCNRMHLFLCIFPARLPFLRTSLRSLAESFVPSYFALSGYSRGGSAWCSVP